MPDGLIVAVGPNGEGKTNLLEGIHFLYALGSPRTSTNAPLVRQGAEAAYTRGEFETENGRVLVEVEIPTQGASKVKVNRSPVRRKRDLRRQVRAVLFGPFDLPIVIGDPSKRRTFMDEAVIALWPLKEGALHRLRPQPPPTEPAAEGMGGLGHAPRDGSLGRGADPGRVRRDPGTRRGDRTTGAPRQRGVRAPRGLRARLHVCPQRLGRRRPGAGLPRSHRGASPRRAAAAHLPGRAASRRPHAGRARPRREGRGLARRNVGHGAVSARRPRHRGHEGARGATGVPGGRPVQRARSHAPRPDR